MSTGSTESDKGLGFGLAFSFLTLLGAAAMLAPVGQMNRAWGFALAVVAGVLAVVLTQAYW